MQEKGIVKYGIAWGWAQAEGLICDYTIILNSFGGEFFDNDGKIVLDTPEARAALQFMYDSIYTHGIADPASTSLTDREVMSLFLNEDIAFVINWDFGWTWSQDPAQSRVIDATRVGLIPGTDKKASSTTGGGSTCHSHHIHQEGSGLEVHRNLQPARSAAGLPDGTEKPADHPK